MLPPDATVSGGACMNKEDAAKFTRMVQQNPVDAMIAFYANFGDLTAFSIAGKAMKGLPMLMLGLPDDLQNLTDMRVDTGNGMYLATSHAQTKKFNFVMARPKVCYPESPEFTANVEKFLAATDTYHSMTGARIGMLGSDTRDFYQLSMQNREPLAGMDIDLAQENLGRFVEIAFKRRENTTLVMEALTTLKTQSDCSGVPAEKLTRMAKLLAQMRVWAKAENLHAAGVDCWTYLQQKAKVCACAAMAAMSQVRIPFACETDVYGALSMLAASAAANSAAGLADITNCVFSPAKVEAYLKDQKIGPALNKIASAYEMGVGEVLSNLSLPFHCGVWPADLTNEGKIIKQVIMEKFLPCGDSIGCRAATVKEGSILTTRIAPNAEGGLTAYIFVSQSLAPIAESFGNNGFLLTRKQEDVMQAIHGDVTQEEKAPFPHHGAMVYCGPTEADGNRVADALALGYAFRGIKVMDLRK
ncbi:MAG: hypothetical protein PHV13_03640 [Candidatus ainarchaeum sp.]|nr:hypothetical protein [Candidatus ainarchaeum sp.]